MNFIKLSSNFPRLSYKFIRTFARSSEVRSGLKKGNDSDAGYGGSRGKVSEPESRSGRSQESQSQSEARSKPKSGKEKNK